MPKLRISLATKLVSILVALSTVGLTAMGALTYYDARGQLIAEGRENLTRTVETRASELTAWANGLEADLVFLGKSPTVRAALAAFRLRLAERYGGDRGRAAGYERARERYRPYFENVARRGGYADIYLVDTAGDVLFAAHHAKHAGEHVGILGPQVAEIAARALSGAGRKTLISDFLPYEASAAAFAVSAIPDAGGGVSGLVLVEVGVDRIENFLRRTGQPQGELFSYLLASDGRPRTFVDAFDPEWRVPGDDPRSTAAAGERGAFLTDEENAKLIAYAPVRVLGRSWGLITEKDESLLIGVATELRRATLFRGLIMIGIAGLVAYGVAYVIVRRLTGLTRSLALLDEGDLDRPVSNIGSSDELGQAARAIDALRLTLRAGRTAGEENRRKSAALATTSAALMMTDPEFNIIYVNRSTVSLMSNRQEDFRTIDPEFDAEHLIGRNMDCFHRVPERVRVLMSRPENLPFHTDIAVGEASLQLRVDAIRDDEGGVLGMVLEWIDVTEERRDQAALDAIDESQLKAEVRFEGHLTRANTNFSAVFGGEDAAEFRFSDKLRQVESGENGGAILAAVASGENRKGRFRLQRASGEVVLDGGFYPIRDLRGRPASAVFIASDVTEDHAAKENADRDRRQMLEDQRQVVEALRVGLDGISSGDLSCRLNTPLAAAHDRLRLDFNKATENLAEAIEAVSIQARSMQQETAEIVNASDDLARRTEKQAMTLQETASSLDELTTNVAATAEGTARANGLVEDARGRAEASGRIVDAAETAMSEIAASSKEVVKVITVIDDIAFQTNLLALNAGVEAARAGPAGRGFAVVATEVRALAQRCADAAAEIGTLISASGQHVTHGVGLVGQTGAALKEIVGSFREISEYIGEIAQAGDQQSRALSQINGAINQIDSATQQNAVMFEETSSAAHALAQRSEALGQAVSRFSLGKGGLGQGAAHTAPQVPKAYRPPVEVSARAVANGPTDLPSNANEWREF